MGPTTMVEEEKRDGWLVPELKTRILIHLLTFFFLTNTSVSDRVAYYSSEPSTEKQIYKIGPGINRNETVYNENVSLCTDIDTMLHWIFDIEKGGRSCSGRSLKFKLGERFAFRKRLQFALLPIMYKMGVMTTLLTGLTVLVLKGLTIGVILLIFAFGNYFSKLHKHSYQSTQPIHVHVHSQDGHSKVTSFPHGIGPWDRTAEEVHPNAYLEDDDVESYRRRLIQNSAAMVKFKPIS